MTNTKSNWLVTESTQIYQDSWIKVRCDKIKRPNGEGSYTVVNFKGGIGVVPLTVDNQIVIVGQYRYAPDRYSWEIPKGGFPRFDFQGDPLDIAKEELAEETGYHAQQWTPLTMVNTLLGSTDDKVYLYLAQELTPGPTHFDPTEDIVVKTVTFDEFFAMVKRQEITDATSIAAAALAQRIL